MLWISGELVCLLYCTCFGKLLLDISPFTLAHQTQPDDTPVKNGSKSHPLTVATRMLKCPSLSLFCLAVVEGLFCIGATVTCAALVQVDHKGWFDEDNTFYCEACWKDYEEDAHT